MGVTTGGSQHNFDFTAQKHLRPLAAGGLVGLVAVACDVWVKGQYFNTGCWVGFSKCQLKSVKTTITQVRLRKDFCPRQITNRVNSNNSSSGAAEVDSLHLNNVQPNYLLVNE